MNELIEILKDKSKIIEYLLKTISTNEKISNGLNGINIPEISTEGKVGKLLEVVSKQSLQIRQLSTILLVYTQSKNFDSQIAEIMVKFGKGEEALQIMLNKKMKGL